ncbi:cbb3-type cytochrome oxidase subunit 3 [Sphingomonas sp. 3-13AW]|uniref:cbb3-type cytochrome oxidase subunit 3 n=1 Tax=Sphingomonas sp. 3-13AW TaxID=3050450 RepID=UPI003BB7BDFF
MNYSDLRHFADSYGLVFMSVVFLVLVGWTFRRDAGKHHDQAAHSIFEEEDRSDG